MRSPTPKSWPRDVRLRRFVREGNEVTEDTHLGDMVLHRGWVYAVFAGYESFVTDPRGIEIEWHLRALMKAGGGPRTLPRLGEYAKERGLSRTSPRD